MSHSPTSEEQPRGNYEQGWQDILDLIKTGGSWSGRERNCCLLNTGGERFADVSAVTGLDFLDDGRCVAPVDWDHDGDLDLWMAARTGPRLRFVRNDTNTAGNESTRSNFVAFQLQGVTCNRNAIGARVRVRTGESQLLRALRSENGYLTQPSRWIHVGLAQAKAIDELEVRWPDGAVEKFAPPAINGRYILKQGAGAATAWRQDTLAKRQVTLESERIPTHPDQPSRHLRLLDRLPTPPLPYTDFAGEPQLLGASQGAPAASGPTLVTLWATWCSPCVEEFNDLASHAQELKKNDLRVLALSVDGLSAGAEADAEADAEDEADAEGDDAKARKFWASKSYPFEAGLATVAMLERLDVICDSMISLRPQPNAIPSSYLFDRHGRLAVVYPGPLDPRQLLDDIQSLNEAPRGVVFPLAGSWFQPPDDTGKVIGELARAFYRRDDVVAASRYAALAADLSTRDAMSPDLVNALASIFFRVGSEYVLQDAWQDAADNFQLCLRFRPNDADAHANLGYVARQLGDLNRAWTHLQIANDLSPDLAPVHMNLGLMLLEQNVVERAAQHLQRCVDLDPEFSEARNYLGVALARMGRLNLAAQHLQRATQQGNQDAKRNLEIMLQGGTP